MVVNCGLDRPLQVSRAVNVAHHARRGDPVRLLTEQGLATGQHHDIGVLFAEGPGAGQAEPREVP